MAGKTMTSTLEIAGVLSPTLEAAIRNAVSNFDEMSEGTLAAAGAAEKLVAEISTQEDVLKSLQKGYADYIVSGQESSEEAQQLADKIQEVSGELENNKDVLMAAEKAAKKLTDSQEDMGDAYTQLERKIGTQEDELEKLRREYANVVLEQGKYSSDAKQLESKISSLSGELNKNKKKLQDVGDAAEKAGNQAENSGEGYTVLKNVIANLASEAIQNAIEKFKELATEGDNTLAMLEARSGASAEGMKSYEDALYAVYNAGYGETLGDVGNALSTVTQMMGDLDDASLAQVTKNAMALDDVFGFDTTESLRSANALMKQFGVSSDEAFNLIVQGAQNGLNQNGDLMDVINEYSNQFASAGFSAEDMFNMLQNGVEAGTWSVDKLGDAVKEYNIRMSDGTVADALKENRKALGMTKKEAEALSKAFSQGGEAGEAAMKSTLDAVMAVEDDTKRYQLGVAMFGTMWEDLGEDAVQALFNTEGGIKAANDAMSQMDAAAYDTLSSKLTVLGRTIEAEVFQPLTKLLLPVAKKSVDFVTNNVGPAVDWVVNNLPTIGVVLAGIAAALVAFKWGSLVSGISKAAGAFKAFGAVLSANPIGLVILGITALVAAFTYLWNNCEGFRNFWIGLWDGIKKTATKAWNKITGIFKDNKLFKTIGKIWDNVSAGASKAWDGIKSTASGAWNSIKSTVSGAWGKLSGVFEGTAIGSAVSGVWNSIKTAASTAWGDGENGIKGALSGLWSDVSTVWNSDAGIGEKISGTWNSIKAAASTAWGDGESGIRGALSGYWSNISSVFEGTAIGSAVSGVWDSIKAAASTAWGDSEDGIKGALSGLWSDVSTVWNSDAGIGEKISGTWNSIKAAASTAWGDGESGIRGALSGYWSNISSVFEGTTIGSAVSSVWGSIKEAASTAWGDGETGIRGALSGYWSNITSVFEGTTIGSAVSSVWGSIKEAASTAWGDGETGIRGSLTKLWGNISSVFEGTSIGAAVSGVWGSVNEAASTSWGDIKSTVSGLWASFASLFTGGGAEDGGIGAAVNGVWNNIKSAASTAWGGIAAAVSRSWGLFASLFTGGGAEDGGIGAAVNGVWNNIKSAASTAWADITTVLSDAWNGLLGIFNNLKWEWPKIPMPHFSITGEWSLNPLSVPSLGVEWYAKGGIMTQPTIFGAAGNTLLAGGEAGAEAILPLSALWDKMETFIRAAFNTYSTTGGTPGEGLTAKAGQLLTLDNFSLGSLADGTNIVVYYDFSGFTWSPQIQNGGTGDNDEDDLMARLRAHEAEFFDWLEEFIQMREVAQYA